MADTLSELRRRVVELEMENKRLLALVPPTNCRECRYWTSPDGIFMRCPKNGMKIVSPDGYCSDGKRRT